jgi:hypothetical protein
VQPRRSDHFWAAIHREDGGHDIQWVQNFYFAPMGEVVLDALSPLTAERVEEIEPERYYREVTGLDGRRLRIPADLDESICRYQQLDPPRRDDFDRAAFWLDMASRQWNISVSTSFAALVSAVESLINQRGRGSAARFQAFFEQFAPGATLATRRNEMYDLRSGILHGSELMAIDQDLAFGWDPSRWGDRELHDELWTVTRIAVRNWLKNPPPV